jgi:hypothetical protein
MKKITIYRDVQLELFKLLKIQSWEKDKLPLTLNNFKIKKERINYIYNYAKEYFPADIFRGNKEELFDIDPGLKNSPEEIKGAIRINHRKDRNELIFEFGSFTNKGKFISYKSDDPDLQFNNAIFACLFHNFIDIIINFNTLEIDWKINFDNWREFIKGKNTIKKFKRKTKEEINNDKS